MPCLGVNKSEAFLKSFGIQYLTTVVERMLFNSVVMALAFGAGDLWFESRPNLIFLPCIYHLFLCYELYCVQSPGHYDGLALLILI